METRKSFDWAALILGILFVILGFVSFYHPDKTLSLISILVGIGAILRGLYELWLRQTLNNLLDQKSTWLMVMAILDIILGLIFLFYHQAGVIAIAYIFAIWFIIDCVGQIQVASFYRQLRKGYYWLLIVLNIIGIIIGVIMLFVPMLSALTIVWLISIFLIVLGVIAIVAAF